MTFEWDDEKETINIEKHGISFETASHVFEDPEYIERVVRDIMDDLPTVSPISFVAVFGKTTVAMLEVTAVIGK